MESIKNAMARVQPQNNSLALSQTQPAVVNGQREMSVSIYHDPMTIEGLAKNIANIKKAFPTLPIEFYEVLKSRLEAKGFGDKRMTDAVNNVIDTCIFPTPTVAQFISWDKRIKMFTYDQMLKMYEEANIGPVFWNGYKSFQFADRPVRVWIHINDVVKYNITE